MKYNINKPTTAVKNLINDIFEKQTEYGLVPNNNN